MNMVYDIIILYSLHDVCTENNDYFTDARGGAVKTRFYECRTDGESRAVAGVSRGRVERGVEGGSAFGNRAGRRTPKIASFVELADGFRVSK